MFPRAESVARSVHVDVSDKVELNDAVDEG